MDRYPAASASLTTCSVCSSGTWKTPKPRIGIWTPLLRVIRRFCVDTVASFVG